MVPRNKKEELDKLDLHLSIQLSKCFPEVDGTKIIDDKNEEKINWNELPILQLIEILSKIDKGEVLKQFFWRKRKQNLKIR